MPNSDLLPSLLFKINENQLAFEADHVDVCQVIKAIGR
ncbi:hypothetical protein PS639_05651 [Pseudomonas fluorescens]|nr:hypothetical protein PS639_05651 [Pseudomonas fluorescens]